VPRTDVTVSTGDRTKVCEVSDDVAAALDGDAWGTATVFVEQTTCAVAD
jgi:thiamine phosphate synthase YjbQ (UPF0047 family)